MTGNESLKKSQLQVFRSQRSNVEKGCLKRWQHHLNPDLTKEKWSLEENRKLFELHKKMGSRWKDIASKFTKRTDNGIKNQFFSIIRKSLRKACKFCGLPINPSTINTIKPKILSQFVNIHSNKSPQLISSNVNNQDNFNETKSMKDDEYLMEYDPPEVDFNNLTISDVIKLFAFKKPQEIKFEIKPMLRDILGKNLEHLRDIKWDNQPKLCDHQKQQEDKEG